MKDALERYLEKRMQELKAHWAEILEEVKQMDDEEDEE